MCKQVFVFSFLSLIALVSCQKDMTAKESPAANLSSDKIGEDGVVANSVVVTTGWYGTYASLVYNGTDPGDPDINYVDGSQFIHNGVAKLPFLQNYTFTYSNITLDIPYDHTITGDSVTFQTVVENTTTDGGISDYDVVLQIVGSQHSAELHFVADAAGQAGNQYYVGNTRYYNLPQLVHYFGSFQTIKWVMKKNGTAAYINGKLAYKFTYGAANQIGRINTINIAGKGYVVVNSVNLLNSYTNKKIMTENFNIDSQGHTVFY